MRLTVHTDYALRLLMALAMDPGERQTIEQIAHRYRISRHHLTKVAQTLVRAGFVDSQRGRGGGLSLRRPAAQITLGSVVRSTEDDFALVECFHGAGRSCSIASDCGLPAPLREALDAFFRVLDRHTLAGLPKIPP
jgi:Rrf2 family transcriptional regulator, nitric oxide-sensitive transcriptional repressor